VGHSLLSSVGLDELVARSVDEYIHIAVELSADKKRLTDLRASMRDRVKASPLLDRRAMGQALGHALRGMWQRHCDSFDAEVPLEDDHVDVPEVIRLHIGGQEIKEGWKIFDITARPEVDFVGDLRDLSAFAEGSCAEVYASHVLEHVPPQDILMVLNGIHRILVPGGTLYLAVPNLDILSWLFSNPAASNAEKFYIMRVIFGGQLDENDLHRIGLNLDFMVDYLTDVGFTSVEQVQSFGLFSDDSEQSINDHRVSLNMVVIK
jgi:predicted SAM-dependent methyltransferase